MATLKRDRFTDIKNCTLKEVFKTRENFRNTLNYWVK